MSHKERKHSKFSASGAERWFNCQGSVALSEGIPSRESVWSREGTLAHEVLEATLTSGIDRFKKDFTGEMAEHAMSAQEFIFDLAGRDSNPELLVETRIHLPFIHPEMFGTFDAAVVEHFGTLDVIDYKYGAGHPVSPLNNLQMLFYGIGVAAKYDWNFKRARLWIIQPRIKNYDGPVFFELGILELKKWVGKFKKAVEAVEKYPNRYNEGSWCHWCSAKSICPLKQQGRLEQAKSVFSKV